MSFSSEIKSELIKIDDLPECCKHAMAYGMLLFGRSFNEQEISIMTDNPAVADKYTELAFDITGIEAKRFVSEAGKTTVSFESVADRKSVLDCFSNSGNEKVMRIDRGNLRNESEAEFEYDMQESINCCNAAFLRGAFLS